MAAGTRQPRESSTHPPPTAPAWGALRLGDATRPVLPTQRENRKTWRVEIINAGISGGYNRFLGIETNLLAGICRIIFHSLIFSLRSLNTFWCFTLIFLYEAITKLFFPYGFYLKIPISLLCFKLMCKCWCHVPQRKYCGGGGWRHHILQECSVGLSVTRFLWLFTF